MAEVYAGFLAHADHHIGRLLDQMENTLIVVVSDNGASACQVGVRPVSGQAPMVVA